ncbi:MarR family winged helix-turn-helix transcriptional regulator [Actinokineospora enzanensis]|uniref:MarR family winged helix-turn-helix transcriptional regulator n=1 Tax=Actinokineospora enzanensis TaxID=155975 RepID=UPI000377F4A0|nr:MarR family transcriptional regulator [Actinokineospora enzanensis]
MTADHDELPDSAVRSARELRALFSRLRTGLRGVADTHDLTPSQAAVLSRLDKQGVSSTSVLAAAERVRPQSMAATVAGLEKQGLVQREPDPEDGRRQLITLTEAGRNRIEGDRQARREWLARAFGEQFTEGERQEVLRALSLLARLTQS